MEHLAAQEKRPGATQAGEEPERGNQTEKKQIYSTEYKVNFITLSVHIQRTQAKEK